MMSPRKPRASSMTFSRVVAPKQDSIGRESMSALGPYTVWHVARVGRSQNGQGVLKVTAHPAVSSFRSAQECLASSYCGVIQHGTWESAKSVDFKSTRTGAGTEHSCAVLRDEPSSEDGGTLRVPSFQGVATSLTGHCARSYGVRPQCPA